MANIRDHQSSSTTKMLFLGPNGAGKTGALASLAGAGYNLRILDLDNGLDVLKNILLDSKSSYGSKAADHLIFKTITDPMKNVNGKLIPAKAEAWLRMVKLLDNWSKANGADEDLGPVSSWSTQDVLVIDGLTMACNAAMRFVQSMEAKLGQPATQAQWYQAQQRVEELCQMLYDEGIKCNVVINCHVTYIDDDQGRSIGYPMTLGKALSPKIGSYFNTILMAKTSGREQSIFTKSQGMVELKNTAPGRVLEKYPLATGLADYFKAVRG